MSVNSKMTAIADAIRAKTGKTAPLTLDQMATEIEGISGGTELFAVIVAYYPTGSTIKCISGNIELSPVGTDGQALFAVPFAGTWTVTATKGTNFTSQSVVITTKGELVDVELAFAYYVFKTGYGVASEWETEMGAAAFADVNASRIQIGSTNRYGSAVASAGSVAKYNTTPYTKINFDLNCDNLSGGNFYVGIASTTTGNSFVASKKLTDTGRQTVTVDITKYNNNYYVKAYQDCWPSEQLIYNIWFE